MITHRMWSTAFTSVRCSCFTWTGGGLVSSIFTANLFLCFRLRFRFVRSPTTESTFCSLSLPTTPALAMLLLLMATGGARRDAGFVKPSNKFISFIHFEWISSTSLLVDSTFRRLIFIGGGFWEKSGDDCWWRLSAVTGSAGVVSADWMHAWAKASVNCANSVVADRFTLHIY